MLKDFQHSASIVVEDVRRGSSQSRIGLRLRSLGGGDSFLSVIPSEVAESRDLREAMLPAPGAERKQSDRRAIPPP